MTLARSAFACREPPCRGPCLTDAAPETAPGRLFVGESRRLSTSGHGIGQSGGTRGTRLIANLPPAEGQFVSLARYAGIIAVLNS